MKNIRKPVTLCGMVGLLSSLFVVGWHSSNASAAAKQRKNAVVRQQRLAFDAAKYFPLNAGDQFTYRETENGESQMRDVEVQPSTFSGMPVMARMEFLEDGTLAEMEFLTSDDRQGILIYGDENPMDDCSTRLSPPMRIPHGLRVGDIFRQTVQVEATGAGCDGSRIINVAVEFKGRATVRVPAGKFENCAEIEMTKIWRDANGILLEEEIETIFFAPRIGIVKVEEGDEILRLISATLGLRDTDTVIPRF
jgi:hypothetical protein